MTDQLSPEEQSYADFLAAGKPEEGKAEVQQHEPEKVEPTPEAPKDESTKDEAAAPESAAAKEAEELFPGYSSLPEEQRSAIDKILSAERARAAKAEEDARRFHNQVAPINRKLAQTERELQRLRSAPSSAPSKQQPVNPPASQAEMHSRLQKLRSELPEEAAAIEELVAANLDPLKKENEELRSQVSSALEQLERQSAFEQMNHVDPEWERKTSSAEFHEWVAVISDPGSEAFDPVMASAIDRIKNTYDVKVMTSVLSHFSRDLAEFREAEKPYQTTHVRKPDPDYQPRRTTASASPKQNYGSAEEQAYAEWLAAQSP